MCVYVLLEEPFSRKFRDVLKKQKSTVEARLKKEREQRARERKKNNRLAFVTGKRAVAPLMEPVSGNEHENGHSHHQQQQQRRGHAAAAAVQMPVLPRRKHTWTDEQVSQVCVFVRLCVCVFLCLCE